MPDSYLIHAFNQFLLFTPVVYLLLTFHSFFGLLAFYWHCIHFMKMEIYFKEIQTKGYLYATIW